MYSPTDLHDDQHWDRRPAEFKGLTYYRRRQEETSKTKESMINGGSASTSRKHTISPDIPSSRKRQRVDFKPNSRECPTCFEEYDSEEHRVRMLNCGHSQCTGCIAAQFFDGRITCSSCRTTHTYSDFNSIPVCYIAEKMKEEIDKLKNQEDAILPAPKLHKGICAEHATYKLFWCNTHHAWICIHCSLIDHPRGDCDIIPIKKKLENDIDLMKLNISKELESLDNTENDIDKQTEEEKEQSKKTKEEIDKLKKVISQKENEVAVLNARESKLDEIKQECKKNKSALENQMLHLHDASTFKELDLENEKSALIIIRYDFENWRQELDKYNEKSLPEIKLQEILEKLKKVTNTNKKKVMVLEAKKILQETIKERNMHVMKNIGNTTFYSSIEESEGCIILNDLQQDLSPDVNFPVLEFDDIMTLVQSYPVAFVTLTHRGTNLGRLHIRLNGPPRRIQQFLELATGSSGCGRYRAARFDRGVENKGTPGEYVNCDYYTTADGGRGENALYQLEEEASPDDIPLTEGTVIGDPNQCAGFTVCTRSDYDSVVIHPVIGQVTSGLPKLRGAIEKYDATDIVFSDCGVIIDASAQIK